MWQANITQTASIEAKITIRKYNNQTNSDYALPTPEYLLMVRKDEMGQFFEKKKLPNSSDSYLSSQFSSVANAYQFSNVAQLITNLKIERDLGAGIEKR